MKNPTISPEHARDSNLHIITYFRPEHTTDDYILKKPNINLGTKEKPRVVDCNIKKTQRGYNHFEWLEEVAKQIEKDPQRTVYVVENDLGERAVAVNRPPDYLTTKRLKKKKKIV